MVKSDYGIDSLRKLRGADPIRKRPESMLGSRGLEGAKHTFLEVVGNSFDELSSGYGDKLEVVYYPEDGSISVRDYGRGVPLTWSEKEQDWGWSIVYNTLYAGGKMDDPKSVLIGYTDWDDFSFKNFSYLASVGLNGVGAACAQFTSTYFTVISYRDGKEYEMRFEKGYPVLDELIVRDEQTQPNGTFIHWKPDPEVFTDVNISPSWLKTFCKDSSYTTATDIYFNDGKKTHLFKGSNIKERLKSQLDGFVQEGSYLHHEEVLDTDGNVTGVVVCEATVVMGGKGAGSYYYNNLVKVQGGVHSDYSHTAILEFFYEKGREVGQKLSSGDILPNYSLIISTLANDKSYRGQTKDSIDNEYIGKTIYYAIRNLLDTSWDKGESWVNDILQKAVESAKIREATEAALSQVKEASKKINKKVMPSKLVSCEALLEGRYDEVELLIVEGESAKGTAQNGRDSRFQAILPIRGKSLNTKKSTVEKALDNDEITELLNVIGAGMTVEGTGYSIFDRSKLRVGKIIIMTDADDDGSHIRALLVNFFGDYLRPLLEEGIIYLANPPKYKSNGVYYFTEQDFQEAKQQGKISKNFERFKGLGQMEPEDLSVTTMHPQTRRLTQVKIEKDDYEFDSTMNIIAGTESLERKRFVLDVLMDGYDNYKNAMEVLEGVFEEMSYEDELEIEEVFY